MVKPGEEDTVQVLIGFYSRGGTTAAVAETLRDRLAAQGAAVTVKRIRRERERGFFGTAFEARRKARPAITEPVTDVGPYDLVLVGFPIFGGSAASPVNSFLSGLETTAGHRFAVFAVSGFATGFVKGIESVSHEVTKAGGEVVATMGFSQNEQAKSSERAEELVRIALKASQGR